MKLSKLTKRLFIILGLLVIALIWQQVRFESSFNKKFIDEAKVRNETDKKLFESLGQIKKDFYLQGEELPDTMSFAGNGFPINNLAKTRLLLRINRNKSALWLLVTLNIRLERYDFIKELIIREGKHPDHMYVAIAESFLNPLAASYRGAKGFWQFIISTGRKYGLTINYYVDERLDPIKSTFAALNYFDDLKERFGGRWPLMAAAYNMGENGLAKKIKKSNTDNYFGLPLNRETANYFINILAWKWIVENEQDFFMRFKPNGNFSIPDSKEIEVTFSRNVRVSRLIDYWDDDYHLFEQLNPIYYRHVILKGKHTLSVPEQSLDNFITAVDSGLIKYIKIVNR